MNLTGQEPYQKGQKRKHRPKTEEQEHYAYAYGTDAQFLEWVSHQPSVIDGDFQQFNPDRNTACHYRRIKHGAGWATKPPFCALPMTHEQHMAQERWGYEHFHPLEWWEDKVLEMVTKWIEHRKALKC